MLFRDHYVAHPEDWASYAGGAFSFGVEIPGNGSPHKMPDEMVAILYAKTWNYTAIVGSQTWSGTISLGQYDNPDGLLELPSPITHVHQLHQRDYVGYSLSQSYYVGGVSSAFTFYTSARVFKQADGLESGDSASFSLGIGGSASPPYYSSEYDKWVPGSGYSSMHFALSSNVGGSLDQLGSNEIFYPPADAPPYSSSFLLCGSTIPCYGIGTASLELEPVAWLL